MNCEHIAQANKICAMPLTYLVKSLKAQPLASSPFK